MKKNKVRNLLGLGLSLTMMAGNRRYGHDRQSRGRAAGRYSDSGGKAQCDGARLKSAYTATLLTPCR